MTSVNSQRKYRSVIAEFVRVASIDYAKFAEVTSDDINQYVAWCKSQPSQPGRSRAVSDRVSQSTIKNKISVLSSLFHELMGQGQVKENPCLGAMRALKRAKGNDRRPHRMVPVEKIRELLNHHELPLSERAMIGLLFGAGLRRSELLKLRFCDVEVGEIVTLRLRDTKDGSTRNQIVLGEMTGPVRQLIASVVPLSPQAPVFGKVLDRTFLRWFKRWMVLVGLPADYSCHDARKTAITLVSRAGLPLKDVQEFARHATPVMTMHYIAVDSDEFLNKIRNLKILQLFAVSCCSKFLESPLAFYLAA